MKLEVSIFELGQILKKIEKDHKLDLLVKSNLSGGWMIITGQANIYKVPALSLGCNNKGNNIMEIKIKDNNKHTSLIKLTGSRDKKFNIDISSTRYREISKNNLDFNEIKINKNECKLRIDENIIFTINECVDEIEKIIKNK